MKTRGYSCPAASACAGRASIPLSTLPSILPYIMALLHVDHPFKQQRDSIYVPFCSVSQA